MRDTSHHDGSMPRRSRLTTSRSSVYPYMALHFVAVGNSSRRPVKHSNRPHTSAVVSVPERRICDSETSVERRSLHNPIHSTAARVHGNTPFREMKALASRARDTRLRYEPFLDDMEAKTEAQSLCFSGGETGGKRSSETFELSAWCSSCGEEPCASLPCHSAMAGMHTGISGGVKVSENLEPSAGDAAARLSERGNRDVFHQLADTSMPLLPLAYNSSTPVCARKDPDSPVVVEVVEEKRGREGSEHLSSFCVNHAAPFSWSGGAESSQDDDAVSPQETSLPRNVVVGNICSTSTTELYHMVQIPHPHYILLQANFSSW